MALMSANVPIEMARHGNSTDIHSTEIHSTAKTLWQRQGESILGVHASQ